MKRYYNYYLCLMLLLLLVRTNAHNILILEEKAKRDLFAYISNQRGWLRWLPSSDAKLISWLGEWQGKGSVTDAEIQILRGLSDDDCKKIVATIAFDEVEKCAHGIFESIKEIKNVNVWHNQLYAELSKYNAEKLKYGANDREAVLKRMLSEKDKDEVKYAFIFGIAVTMIVEKMKKEKK